MVHGPAAAWPDPVDKYHTDHCQNFILWKI